MFVILFILTCGAWLLFGYIWLTSNDMEFPEEDKAKFRKILKTLTVATYINFLFLAFIPSKQTLIEMEVAKHVTVKNLQEAKKEFVKFIHDITGAIKQVNGG